MKTQIALHHLTKYKYDRLVQLGPQIVRLRPAPHARTHINSYSLKINVEKHFLHWQQDPFGNYLARILIPEKVKEFQVEVDLVAEIQAFNPFDFFHEEYAEKFPFKYEESLAEELGPYLEIKDKGKLLIEFLKTVDSKKMETNAFLVSVNQKINKLLKYIVRMEPGVQTCEETLKLKSGSCRDMAWLLCQVLRHLGLASRFTSGYLIQLKPDQLPLDTLAGSDTDFTDFTDLHAWTEVYLPGAGWVGLDPTSGNLASEGHIPLCCTPNPSSAAPITGVLGPCETTFEHKMHFTRIKEDLKLTKPYSQRVWNEIDQIGQQVDQDLAAKGVQLTMGGEPTFVSLEDLEGEEWHFTAMGPNKRKLGKDLLLRLRDQFSPGSVLHFGQGKWYPGEIMPRWSLNCFWRKDGVPIWGNISLLADIDKNYNHDAETAQIFILELARQLGIPSNFIIPAREDAVYHLWKENRLPQEGEVLKADLFEKTERERLHKLLDKNLSEPIGYVLPLLFSVKFKRWISSSWNFRNDRLILTPGDSPMGLRLPFNSLTQKKVVEEQNPPERSPFELIPDLPTFKDSSQAPDLKKQKELEITHPKDETVGLIRPALCVESRDGLLHIFLPPTTLVENFLDLVSAIEKTSKSLDIPIVLEGYEPPNDLRISNFKVTPDPGVIEVNVQPSGSWEELKNIINTVYEEARLSKLSTDKFLLDGRRVGTGGGNHITIGGSTPEDSPFLKRPDMLRSIVAFWQNHPSLSYLFSSMFIGPTSQSPRIDEARLDSLYELEIAFQQTPEFGESPYWLVDRLFRNILVDITGNTHRAEICIDKLYSPDSDRGRLGLVELRGFEMSPHPQMNLLQALLVRACVSAFWTTPYRQKPVRWGTELHDRFMLPHYLWEDLSDVVNSLNIAGYDFKLDWFLPFRDFRFPYYGSTRIDQIQLELRMALEPWNVLGEEMYQGSVSRSVDSSVERLQLKVEGYNDSHYLITCNGRPVPLRSTGQNGVYVAGIRYKAWAPPSCLHSTLPIHTPLVIDIIDRRYERSIGGCTYYVTHPGGRHYEKIPVNESEAESRLSSRFQAMGHSPGQRIIPATENNKDFPYTLDLRRSPVY